MSCREYCVLNFGRSIRRANDSSDVPVGEEPGDAGGRSNPGIVRDTTRLVKEAGEKMPAWRKKRDYRWKLHMQKAALDQYLQYKLRIEIWIGKNRYANFSAMQLTSGSI